MVIWEGERFEASVVKASRRTVSVKVVWANAVVEREVRAKRMEMEVGLRILEGYSMALEVECLM